ncbi:MAG: FliI/YscN family ATPase [Deltaproteobacteria bacterium]|nr:FliI/YscN family ATPase [Deltaproteobacteria bacterium]
MSALDPQFFGAVGRRLPALERFAVSGRVRSVVGLLVEVEGIRPALGAFCSIETGRGEARLEGEIVGLREGVSLVMPFGDLRGIRVGAAVRIEAGVDRVPTGAGCLGRVLDALGRPIDGKGPLVDVAYRPIDSVPVGTVTRARIAEPLDLGLRALNVFATVGRGMRIGIFAGSGVGKSTLLGQLASHADVDVSVIGLIGERRREVREFIERDLGDALARSVVVVSTSDEPATLRTRGARVATAIAEGFRDAGRDVLLMMDSLTRFCTAQREIGLATGEPPTTRGYTPSVWNQLPKLVERAGTTERAGSITGLYTILVEGDDMNEPVADAARSLLDGHVELSRRIAERGRFPAVDVLSSVSRVMPDVTSAEHQALAREARQALATYRDAEDLISVGAYAEGSDPAIDRARRLQPALQAFLNQPRGEVTSLADSVAKLRSVLRGGKA